MATTKLHKGEKAPDFCLQNQDKKEMCLHDHLGKNIILYFYPKDNTPGCSLEALMFTKYKTEFEKQNTIIFGISKDSCDSHKSFIINKHLNITLLADIDKAIHQQYGVWRPKKFMGKEFMGTIRTTFLINTAGIIENIWDNVKVKGHVEAVLNHVKSLQ